MVGDKPPAEIDDSDKDDNDREKEDSCKIRFGSQPFSDLRHRRASDGAEIERISKPPAGSVSSALGDQSTALMTIGTVVEREHGVEVKEGGGGDGALIPVLFMLRKRSSVVAGVILRPNLMNAQLVQLRYRLLAHVLPVSRDLEETANFQLGLAGSWILVEAAVPSVELHEGIKGSFLVIQLRARFETRDRIGTKPASDEWTPGPLAIRGRGWASMLLAEVRVWKFCSLSGSGKWTGRWSSIGNEWAEDANGGRSPTATTALPSRPWWWLVKPILFGSGKGTKHRAHLAAAQPPKSPSNAEIPPGKEV
ncbi:hypothetical protein GALMADRAFT_215223 [Galerina marginata CBS 339.88]|uniref:Uncharacterized protein n=1 Tax=Galerina marginata (strain CBS 339.88) TaxID=685588 RepID=A0A067SQY6_GALM3|nr:hypothetical protein GALMADRAFT_215223 [Galerina marginata CBS 339.88]